MPNILRGTLIGSASKSGRIMVVETNIDDCSGEVIGSLFETVRGHCLDIFCAQTTGKKNRPAMHITILCEDSGLEKLAEILFAHTSTAGIRYHRTDRIIMDRETVQTKVQNETVRVKKLSYKGIAKFSPEWDDCVKAAIKTGLTPVAVYEKAKAGLI